MAVPTTRNEFIARCKRALGDGMISINVTDDQVGDCVDESLDFFTDYHPSASYVDFLKHKITEQNKTDKYVILPQGVQGVSRLFPIDGNGLSSGLFSPKRQHIFDSLHNLSSGMLQTYVQGRMHIELINDIFSQETSYRYSIHRNRLFIDTDWTDIRIGSYILLEVTMKIEPSASADIWSDRWLINYCTEKIRFQWGSNLSKFSGIQMVGGVEFSGKDMVEDARSGIEKLEESIKDLAIPFGILIG